MQTGVHNTCAAAGSRAYATMQQWHGAEVWRECFIERAHMLSREPDLAAALQQAAAERALMRAELDETRCELRVTQRQLEVWL